jgi:endonuclease YncB( thermonuclease family)
MQQSVKVMETDLKNMKDRGKSLTYTYSEFQKGEERAQRKKRNIWRNNI